MCPSKSLGSCSTKWSATYNLVIATTFIFEITAKFMFSNALETKLSDIHTKLKNKLIIATMNH